MIILSKKYFFISIILIGFSTIIAQTLYIREFLRLFYGNEIVIGSFLGIWLIWTAIGSGLLAKKIKMDNHKQFATIQFIWILLLFITLIIIRSLPLFGFPVGEITDYFTIFWIIFFVIAPFCILSGIIYTKACQLHFNRHISAASWYSRIFLLESLGATLGGLSLSFIFFTFFNSIQIICLLIGLNLFFIFISILNKKIFAFIFIIVTLFIIYISKPLESITQNWLSPGRKTISIQTKYGHLSFSKMGDQYNFFSNGLHLFTIPDPLNAESNTHLAMLQHDNPQKVLLIGGGVSGILSEMLKYNSIQKIDYVELDPQLIQFVKKQLPLKLYPPDNRKIHYHFMDGRRYILKTKNKYDVILLNIPNPYTLQLNRYYTMEFFSLIRTHLTATGIVSISLPASENLLSPELANYLGSIYTTLKKQFNKITILPGETIRFVASTESNYLTANADTLIQRLRNRCIQTKYIQDYYLLFQLSEERTVYFNEQIKNAQIVKINRDKTPAGFYFDVILWATYFSKSFKQIFTGLSKIQNYWTIVFTIMITCILFWITAKNRKSIKTTPWIYSIYIIGFTEISIEYIYILLFQIYFGYAYHHIALIIACYMIGLTLGSYTAFNTVSNKNSLGLKMIRIQGTMILCLLTFFITINLISSDLQGTHIQNIGLLVLTLLLILNGFLGGYQFIVANHLLQKKHPNKNSAGILYGIDLTGSSLGIILTTIFLIPIFGIDFTLIFLITSNILIFLYLWHFIKQ